MISHATQLARRIVESAACAGRRGTDRDVARALEWGAAAAKAGHPIELPILLDAASILHGDGGYDDLSDGHRAATCHQAAEYDAWIECLCSQARDYAGKPRRSDSSYWSELTESEVESFGLTQTTHKPDYLPFLMAAAPSAKNGASAKLWGEAYALIKTSDSHCSTILKNLRGSRWSQDPQFRHLPGESSAGPLRHDPAPAGLWSRYAALAGVAWLQETVDHVAGEIYLRAGNLRVTESQSSRIDRLLRRQREFISYPLSESICELDPFYGVIALPTLCMGKYGEYKIVNRTDIRLTDPPSALPPEPVHVHLCWMNGFPGVWTRTALPLPDDSTYVQTGESSAGSRTGDAAPTTGFEVSLSSVLQGVVAILIDDWRAALARLPLSFYLHNGTTSDKGLAIGKGGRRWTDPDGGTYLPPARAVVHMFTRQSHTEHIGRAAWRLPENTFDGFGDLWCGCILASDLSELDFQPCEDVGSGHRTIGWLGPADRLPSCLSHVIVLEPERERWSICGVRNSGTQIALRMHVGCAHLGGEPYPYPGLRSSALDMLLSALEERV